MRLLALLRRKRAPVVALDHPVFGLLVREGAWWLHEGGDEGIAIDIPTVRGEPPGEADVAFFQRTISDEDALHARVASLVGREYAAFYRRPVPQAWREAFRLSGIALPLHGDGTRPWNVTLRCLDPDQGALFTCYFVDGRPASVTIDD
ncbi:MAG: hypothetical protein ACTHKZ_00400 [Lysobacteraceae bacterium]